MGWNIFKLFSNDYFLVLFTDLFILGKFAVKNHESGIVEFNEFAEHVKTALNHLLGTSKVDSEYVLKSVL